METAHLKLCQRTTTELFSKNSCGLLTIHNFAKNAPSKMFDWVLNTFMNIAQGLHFILS